MHFKTLFSCTPLLSLVLAAACAPASSEAPESADGQLAAGANAESICATIDYGHTVKPVAFYRQFETDATAADFVQKIVEQGKLAQSSGPDAKFQGITRDARLVKLVGDVFAGYQKAFPRETEGMTAPPRVAIIETDIVNAFAMGPGTVEDDSAPLDKAPWLFFIHTALLDKGGTDNELRGLIGHELGHLILRTFMPEIRQRVRTVYQTAANEDGILGATQPNDAALDEHVEEIQKRRDRVGGLAELGLNVIDAPRLPVPGRYYLSIIKPLLAGAEEQQPGSCATAKQHIAELAAAQTALIPHAAEGNDVPTPPSADQKAHLDDLSATISNDLRACIPNEPGSLAELTAAMNQLPPESLEPSNPKHEQLLALMLDAEKQVDADMPEASALDRVLAAEAKIRAELLALTHDAKHPIDQTRIYDYEEDADDASIRVLTALGQDPLGNGTLLVKMGLPKDLQQPCFDAVAAHEPIAYGQFIDPHPATCWRYYHATQVVKALSQCTAQSAKPAPAKGSGKPSVVDKAPSEVVERGYGKR